jgi:hypothetical protein
MKSKFSFWAYFVTGFASMFTLLLLFCITADIIWNSILPFYFYILVTAAVLFVWCWLVLGELRKKVVGIEIGFDHFVIKRYLGFGPSNTFYFEQVDGYKLSFLYATNISYEYLYLMVGDKKAAKLSTYYHRNYADLKESIVAAKIKNLGIEGYNSLQEVKEIFT